LTLNPKMFWGQVAFAEAQSLLRDQFTPDYITDTVKTHATRAAKQLIRQIPSLEDAALNWLDQYRRGRFVVELDTRDLARNVEHFSHSIRRLTIALILVGVIIGSAIASSLLVRFQDSQWEFLPILTMVIFVVALIFGAAAVLQGVRSWSKENDSTDR
jgi:hypothetical protein